MFGCLLCGERGLADFALNVLLFVPLGAALAWAGERGRTALGAGALLSLGIEVAQLAIPGRDSSLSDVVSNTIGSLVGWLAVTHGPRVVALPSRTAALLTAAAAALPSLVVAATGALFRPDFPHAQYYGGWTPDFGHMARYRGRVLSARVAGVPILEGALPNSDTVRALLRAGTALELRVVVGPRVSRLAPLLSINDDAQREILLLGADRDDLVLRWRMRAAAWRLDQPEVRVAGAFAGRRNGDTIALAVHRSRDGYCIAVEGGARTCGLNFGPGRGWSLLRHAAGGGRGWAQLADATWLAALFAPLGWCACSRRGVWGGAALLLALGVAPPLARLLPAGVAEWAGGAAGLLLGTAGRARCRPRARPRLAREWLRPHGAQQPVETAIDARVALVKGGLGLPDRIGDRPRRDGAGIEVAQHDERTAVPPAQFT